MARRIDRRDFLKKTAAAGACLGLAPGAAEAAGATPGAKGSDAASPDAADAARPRAEDAAPLAGPREKSRVVEVSAPGVLGPRGMKPDGGRVRRMVERGVLDLTGKRSLEEAWRTFVEPGDVVGIKINSGGGRFIATKREIFETVIEGVKLAGVPAKNIVLWDQVEEYLLFGLKRLGVKTKGEDGTGKDGGDAVRYRGCTPRLDPKNLDKKLPGYETEPVKFPWGEVRVAELVAKELTAIINLPVLKDHSCAGVTLALKNISHASVNTPWLCHADCCDPAIADIVSIPSIRSKLRLHILDGLFGLADGGPPMKSLDKLFRPEKMLFSRDPVALDSIGTKWIVAARKEMGFPPLEEAENAIEGVKGRAPKHVKTAAARGLGTDDPERMEIVRVTVPGQKAKSEKEPEKKGEARAAAGKEKEEMS